MQTVWDPEKAKENRAKHGVSFPDAEPVLFDPHAITREDEYAEGEQRFVTVGVDALGRVLVVVYNISGRDCAYHFGPQGHPQREQSV